MRNFATTALASITSDNGAIQKLTELLKEQGYKDESLMATITPMLNVENGKHLGWVGDLSDVGWAGNNCNPEYVTPTINLAEKTWSLGGWSMPLEWCYKNFEDTIAEYALKKGTEIGDLTGTELWNILIEEPLAKALANMYWRIVWFGDTAAKNVSAGGVITNGVSNTLFTTTDGLWKKLFAVAAAHSEQHTTIAANSEATAALQKSSIRTTGTAIAIFDALFADADPRIELMGDTAVYCTKSLADALSKDLMKEYKWILQWEQVTNGVRVAEYDGKKIVSVAKWDEMIAKYQNNGTTLNLPHRAFYGSTSQLFVGTPANDIVSDVDVNFDHKKRTTYAYATGKIGTLVGQDNLFQIAY